MSQPTPMPRSMMQTLKSRTDQENRMSHINKLVNTIYTYAINSAKGTNDTSYNHVIPFASAHQTPNIPCLSRPGIGFPAPYKKSSDPFYIENMSDILANLQLLFPECSVSHSIMAKGKDGKLYDVAKLDDAVLPFVDRALDQSYIVIDWS